MEYTINNETGKIELVFDKSEYLALPDELKSKIKSNYLFSRRIGGWISRAKKPNLFWAQKVAEELGASFAGETGERLTFAEQMEQKAQRAEARAERMEQHAANAEQRAEALQKPFNDVRGDLAFLTQPNINTAGGRAFTNRRNRIFDSYDRGMEEWKKSRYYMERAETARQTAKTAKMPGKGFCQRRIDEANASIRACRRNIDEYEKMLEQIAAGEQPINKHGWESNMTAEQMGKGIDRWLDRVEEEMEKIAYYDALIEQQGGIAFAKETLHPGDFVSVARWGTVKVVKCNPKTFEFEHSSPALVYADGTPMHGRAEYAEIKELVKAAG